MKVVKTTLKRILAKHPVREGFAGCSTGSSRRCGRVGYYETKGHAVQVFDSVLAGYGLHLDRDDLYDFHNDEGRKIIAVCNELDEWIGRAVISWFRMESGKYEFTGYLA